MASFTFKSVDASDIWGIFFGFDQSIAIRSISTTMAVFESGDFIFELTGTGLKGGSSPTGTITGVKYYLSDLSAPGGRVEIFSGTGLNLTFLSVLEGFAEDPFGSIDLLFARSDVIVGSIGNDVLYGGAGNDSASGSDGADQMFGGFGDFEDGDGNDTLVGGNGDDQLYGEDGNDSLVGGAGNDQLVGDVQMALMPSPDFPAAAGTDTMLGGPGNDSYWVDRATDVVTEAVGAGTNDRVVMLASDTLLSYTLPAEVENLSIQTPGFSFTSASIPVTSAKGNGLANKISVQAVPYEPGAIQGAVRFDGAGGNDRITGGAANDTLTGGTGADTLIGGTGADDFVLSSSSAADLIYDFKGGSSTAGDDIMVSRAGIRIGDGDTALEGAIARSASGGFAKGAELVVFTSNISGSITTAAAAAKVGSATSAYAVGNTALFAVDNGTSSAVLLFTAVDADAVVEATELRLLATLTSTPSTAVSDYGLMA
jgi:Ca2+-binding RTX toxin-like protein